MNWIDNLRNVLADEPCVLVTLNLILGSAPRESGSRMIVTRNAVHGSIGGGNLEYRSIGKAREMLSESAEARQVHEPVGLGPVLNQCCGGAVTVLYEVLPRGRPEWLQALVDALKVGRGAVLASAIDRPLPEHAVLGPAPTDRPEIPAEVRDAARALLAAEPSAQADSEPLAAVELEGDTWWLEPVRRDRVPLLLFGAGHVGREVARLLSRLPFAVSWIDSRENAFDGVDDADGVTCVRTDDPAACVRGAGTGTLFVVMTHSHQLDEAICREVLERDEFGWLGLIGSDTKRRRFEQRLARHGISADRLARLVCPIGLDGIRGKQPATIALSLVAQLMSEKPWTRQSRT